MGQKLTTANGKQITVPAGGVNDVSVSKTVQELDLKNFGYELVASEAAQLACADLIEDKPEGLECESCAPAHPTANYHWKAGATEFLNTMKRLPEGVNVRPRTYILECSLGFSADTSGEVANGQLVCRRVYISVSRNGDGSIGYSIIGPTSPIYIQAAWLVLNGQPLSRKLIQDIDWDIVPGFSQVLGYVSKNKTVCFHNDELYLSKTLDRLYQKGYIGREIDLDPGTIAQLPEEYQSKSAVLQSGPSALHVLENPTIQRLDILGQQSDANQVNEAVDQGQMALTPEQTAINSPQQIAEPVQEL